ncbi:site-2 protease family protein [Rhodococcus sp. ABRD24]|uniref:site-2 protease family protein n=1 Tax=Rhodococcus sp. ABRD24 TaxID=2507582 RepID=UPI00103A91CA|nr:site-2 protease family protein [Rhodococcus sp. ABRD24]QBJ96931.1 site-2 protease family protein [Rhodococcus sp. ABRD24]
MLKWSIPAGRVFGVRLYLHWSLLVTLALIAGILATSVLPTEFSDRSAAEYWAVGTLAAAVFLVSLAAHEMAHSIVAVRDGVPVERITLWLLGGMSELRGEPADPRSELRIALSGPLTSLTIGIAALLLATVLNSHVDPVVTASIAWLGTANVVLAVFNLLPGAPLDGGRVLHAALWRRSGDRLSAAAGSARSGRAIGLALIALGAVQAVFLGSGAGLWLMLLGWFLRTAANAELASASMRHQMGDLRVGDIMTTSPDVAEANDQVSTFLADVLPTMHHRTFPVVDRQGRPVGVLSLRDLSRASAADRAGTIGSLARPLPDSARVHRDDHLATVAASAMLRPGLDLLAVVDGEQIVGVVTSTDLVRVCERTALGLPFRRPPAEPE